MAAIIYDRAHNLGAYGRMETPIKMIIEHESDLLTKKGGLADWLFNIEKSQRFAETIINNNELDTFDAIAEGDSVENPDSMYETSSKYIEHIQFMKEFVITKTMLEDSVTGVAADAKLRAENFVRAYYKTMHMLASQCLANGHLGSFNFNGHTVDVKTGDGVALFSAGHTWGKAYEGNVRSGTQSNAFKTDLAGAIAKSEDAGSVEDILFEAAVKLRNMKDENGLALGYTADTIVLPGNMPKLEKLVKAACGSESMTGGDYNDINLQYGNWSIVVDPFWQPTSPEFRVMSSEANKALRGNMLFNRVPLTIRTFIDDHSWNNCWSGRCRIGAGFGTYKHIITIADNTASHASTYTTL